MRESVRNKIVDSTRLSWADKDPADELHRKFTPLARRIRALSPMNSRATIRWRPEKHSTYLPHAIHSHTGLATEYNELPVPSILTTVPLVLQHRSPTLFKDAAKLWPQ